MHSLFVKKHDLFLSILFSAFSLKDDKMYETLYDFAMIEYRHLNWLGTTLAEKNQPFDYTREEVTYKSDTSKELLIMIKEKINSVLKLYTKSDEVMFKRFVTDEEFFLQKIEELLNTFPDEKITAYDKTRVLEPYELDTKGTDSLTQFLSAETYKEYELIMVYTYVNFYTDSKLLSNIFMDLIYESFFHLKSFARMLSKMGILHLPRPIMKEIYQFDDLEKFLHDGIKEEEMAKQECIKLASEVKVKELSAFFNFINFQENYHIELMQKALKHLEEQK